MNSAAVHKSFDVLVVGGGAVGNTFIASLLKKSKMNGRLKIGIVDIKEPPKLADCLQSPIPNTRVYALSPATIKILDGCDAWKSIRPRSHPYLNMNIWEETGNEYLEFGASHLSTDILGRIAEDNVIHASLASAIKELDPADSIDYIYGSNVESLELISSDSAFPPTSYKVTMKNPDNTRTTFDTKLLIGADGANSSVRRLSGLAQWGWGYGQEAIVATVKTEKQHETAWQKYLKTGPLALLPLWSQFSSIVWSVPVVEAQRLKRLPDSEFLIELNNAFQLSSTATSGSSSPLEQFPFKQLNPFKSQSKPKLLPPAITSIVSPRLSFPLQFQQAKSYVGARVALIGDAAHSIHPQAGQGLNLGIGDADALSTILANGLKAGQDVGDASLLEKYGSRRYLANIMMMGSVDSLNSIFMSDIGKIKLLRSFGLRALNQSDFVKNQIARFAMGL